MIRPPRIRFQPSAPVTDIQRENLLTPLGNPQLIALTL